MGHLIVSEHVTIDGFLAGPNGEMDCFGLDNEMFDLVGTLTDAATTACYGRNTYEMMDGYWPAAGAAENASKHDKEHSEWYNKVDKIVLSRSMMGKDHDSVRFITSDDLSAISHAKQTGNVLVFGSPSAVHTLFEAGLVDELYLFVNGITLGTGIPLFNGNQGRQDWKMLDTRLFAKSGVTMIHCVRK